MWVRVCVHEGTIMLYVGYCSSAYNNSTQGFWHGNPGNCCLFIRLIRPDPVVRENSPTVSMCFMLTVSTTTPVERDGFIAMP